MTNFRSTLEYLRQRRCVRPRSGSKRGGVSFVGIARMFIDFARWAWTNRNMTITEEGCS